MNETVEKKRRQREKKRGAKGMGSVFGRGRIWWIAYTHEGTRYTESSQSTVKQAATDLLKDRLAEIRGGTFAPGAARVTLSKLKEIMIADLKANGRKYETRVEECFAHLYRLIGEGTTAGRIGEKLDSYIQTRLVETIGPTKDKDGNPLKDKDGNPIKPRTTSVGTVNRELACLKRAFRLAIQKRRLTTMPYIELLEEKNVRTRFPEPEEVEAVIGHLPERLQPAIRFLALTGWRVSEALHLRWKSVDFKAGTIRLEAHETKGGEVRVYPFGQLPALAAIISERKAATEAWERENGAICQWVFWHVVTDENGRPTASQNHVYARAWNRACEKAKVADLHLHDLRRGTARALIRAGVPEKVAMQLLGHRTRSIFDRYHITDGRDLAEGVRKLARATGALQAQPRRVRARKA
jgi:integrase